MPIFVSLKIGCYPPIPFLDEVVAAIYSSPLIHDKLLSIADHAKDGILEIKLTATNCISDFHPRGMIKRCIEEELGRIKTHLLARKIKEKEKELAEKVWHLIENNAILHRSYAHHFHEHGVLDIFQQVLFVPHGHECNPPMVVHFTSVQLSPCRGKMSLDRKSTRLNSSHSGESRMPSSA